MHNINLITFTFVSLLFPSPLTLLCFPFPHYYTSKYGYHLLTCSDINSTPSLNNHTMIYPYVLYIHILLPASYPTILSACWVFVFLLISYFSFECLIYDINKNFMLYSKKLVAFIFLYKTTKFLTPRRLGKILSQYVNNT